MLSRIPLKETVPTSSDSYLYSIQIAYMPITAGDIKRETLNDNDLKKVMECLQNKSWFMDDKTKLKSYFLKRQEIFIGDVGLEGGYTTIAEKSY